MKVCCYVTHHEALALTYASNYFSKFNYIDKLGSKVYFWLGKFTKMHGELKSLMDSFQIDKLHLLQIIQMG